MVHELKLESAVTIHPWMERSEFRKLYARSSAFLFPSHEGAGMVVAEALSFGLPVVCFSNHGPGEFIDASCGITIDYGRYDTSITRFAMALKSLHDNSAYARKLSEGAVATFNDRFDWNSKGEKLKDVYDSLTLKAV
jgi:glycosyltransferase involved in cell wall biosynthesis